MLRSSLAPYSRLLQNYTFLYLHQVWLSPWWKGKALDTVMWRLDMRWQDHRVPIMTWRFLLWICMPSTTFVRRDSKTWLYRRYYFAQFTLYYLIWQLFKSAIFIVLKLIWEKVVFHPLSMVRNHYENTNYSLGFSMVLSRLSN